MEPENTKYVQSSNQMNEASSHQKAAVSMDAVARMIFCEMLIL